MVVKTQVIKKLQQHKNEIPVLKGPPFKPTEYQKWRRDLKISIEKIFGTGSRQATDLSSVFYLVGYDGDDYSSVNKPQVCIQELNQTQILLDSLITEVEEYWENEPEPISPNPIWAIERICRRFHLVARQLRNRHDNRETLDVHDEYDTQDLFHALLTLEFDDIRPEEWTPSYAGSASRTDFLLKQERIVVELKKTRKDLGAKQVGEHLIVDIKRYKAHPDCKALVCFVYDPDGNIANPRGIENDLNGSDNEIDVKVIIAPSGI